MNRNRPSNKRHNKQNVAAALPRVHPPLAKPKLIMVTNRQHRCHTGKGDFSVSQVILYNTAHLHQPYDIPAEFQRKERQALPRGRGGKKRILAKTRMKIEESFVRCTTMAHREGSVKSSGESGKSPGKSILFKHPPIFPLFWALILVYVDF